MDPEYGKGRAVAEFIEGMLEMIAIIHGLEFKTPPHDIAAWVVKELKKKR